VLISPTWRLPRNSTTKVCAPFHPPQASPEWTSTTSLPCPRGLLVFWINRKNSVIRLITPIWTPRPSVSIPGRPTTLETFSAVTDWFELDTSVQSANGHSILTPPPSNYQSSMADHTPSPINTSMLNQPLPSPGSGSMSVASMVSPTTDQSMLRRLDRQSYDSGNMSAGFSNFDIESRRQSVNSQLGQGLGDLKLGSSPYASNNQSTTSIQSTLQQQRNPGGAERNSLGRFYTNGPTTSQRTSAPISLPDPISPRGPRAPIIAPAITGPAQGNIARAPEAIPGQAWAFPEEPIQQLNSRARPSAESLNRQGTSFLDLGSRRSSLADSVASSQFTTESKYPQGQRRLDDNAHGQDYQRLSRASSEFQNVSTHHHSLQHKQVSDLQSDAGSPNSSQPYSRTPELRVSHKLAERKRRTEMKDLFDQLRDLMPQERGSKASKWEILTKGTLLEYMFELKN